MSPLAATELPPASAYESTLASGVSASAVAVVTQWRGAGAHSRLPLTRQARSERFEHLRLNWLEERGVSSRPDEIILAPSYQRIIAMGDKALPMIFESLRQGPEDWFWALHVITGANPVRDEEEGDVPAMTRAWLRWASTRGL